jgi:hypothetical protein
MNKTDSTILSCLGILVLLVILLPGSIIMSGWVLTILWSWFIVPVFNLPSLTIPYAIGISTVISMLTNKTVSSNAVNNKNEKKETSTVIAEALALSFGVPLFLLFFGWIITLFL